MLKDIYEMLESSIHEQMSKGMESINTKEMGEAVDMLKDISMARYYMSVVHAMENGEEYHVDAVMHPEMHTSAKKSPMI